MMQRRLFPGLRAVLLGAFLAGAASAVVAAPSLTVVQGLKLPTLFSNNMVLQRDMKVPVWGWAHPGEKIQVALAGQIVSTQADKDGRWKVNLAPMSAGGPYDMVITSQDKRAFFEDVLVGDVWICSGQSNMAFTVDKSAGPENAKTVIANAQNPKIRLFSVARTPSQKPLDEVPNSSGWLPCSPDSVTTFSAVGYFFGRDLQKQLDVPVGLIHTSWGGTGAQLWTSQQSLKDFEEYKEAYNTPVLPKEKAQDFKKQIAAWMRSLDAKDPGTSPSKGQSWQAPDLDDTQWKTMELPVLWEAAGLPRFDGIVWFRRTIDIPANWVGQKVTMNFDGGIEESDKTYVNGVLVGEKTGAAKRNYSVPASALKAGKNVIAVRVLDNSGPGGFRGVPEQMYLQLAAKTPAGDSPTSISLAGTWKYCVGVSSDKLPKAPQDLTNQLRPSALYNGMVAPLVPYAIRGVIWYQGENNAPAACGYNNLFSTMIRDWRSHWGQGSFPFLFVQLANYKARAAKPCCDDWAELREAQLQTLSEPNTGMAVTIDLGEANDIHPKDKVDVGHRLALAARYVAYGEKQLVYSGPIYKPGSLEIKGSEARLAFSNIGSGLEAKGGELKGFAVAGKDGKFSWAKARIEGDTVVVSSREVEHPLAVRYGWASNPEVNLYNKEGLPASPFRTDDWPGVTEGKTGASKEAKVIAKSEGKGKTSDKKQSKSRARRR